MRRNTFGVRLGAAIAAVVAGMVLGAPSGAVAATCPNEALRENAAQLIDCRAYELVSPQEKGNADVSGTAWAAVSQAAPSGDAVVYTALGGYPGLPVSGALPYFYRAQRGPSGWRNESLTPPAKATLGGCGPCTMLSYAAPVFNVSEDLGSSVVGSNVPLAPGAGSYHNLYRQEGAGAAYKLLTPGAPTAAEVMANPAAWVYYENASADLSHVVFSSGAALTSDAVASGTLRSNLYEFSNGRVSLVSLDEHGAPIDSGAFAIVTSYESEHVKLLTPNAVSRTGDRIFFGQFASPLYVRIDSGTPAARTVLVPDARAPLWAADPDGRRAVSYTSSGAQMYDVDGETVHPICSGDCTIVGVSGDARAVYFLSRQTLNPAHPITGGDKGLYVWRQGSPTDAVAYVATVEIGSNVTPTFESNTAAYARGVSFDGDTFVFKMQGKVDGRDTNGRIQLFVHDASTGAGVTCVSCPPVGEPSADATLGRGGNPGTQYGARFGNARNVSDDGRRVFFETADALVPEDVNGKVDVYVWQDGAPHLISDGKGRNDARFLSASPSGDDAFIATRNQLLESDRDDFVDAYDVRVGGGFAPTSRTAACEGDGCQTAPRPAPGAPAIASGVLDGEGNAAKPPAAARFNVAALNAGTRLRLARTGKASLRVTVSTGGRVTVRGSAALRGRSVQVLHAVRTATRAGTLTVPLRLSSAARGELRRGRTLTVRLTVTHARARGAKRVVLRLRLAGARAADDRRAGR